MHSTLGRTLDEADHEVVSGLDPSLHGVDTLTGHGWGQAGKKHLGKGAGPLCPPFISGGWGLTLEQVCGVAGEHDACNPVLLQQSAEAVLVGAGGG